MVEYVDHVHMQIEGNQESIVDEAFVDKTHSHSIMDIKRNGNSYSTSCNVESTMENIIDKEPPLDTLEDTIHNDTMNEIALTELVSKERISTTNSFECLNSLECHSMDNGILVEHVELDLSHYATSKGNMSINGNCMWIEERFKDSM
ncbi:unnamed protein product [Dovyalis caffra]|uniref:Uncharacterized protein n=1 Tax=Dovyalis caffra TaxID=77055 RepID=A0AAV1RP47_9ROSI|nr:unnamed protein product [Dovyalis caffra]